MLLESEQGQGLGQGGLLISRNPLAQYPHQQQSQQPPLEDVLQLVQPHHHHYNNNNSTGAGAVLEQKYGGTGGNNYTKGYQQKDSKGGFGQQKNIIGRAKISEAAARNINHNHNHNQGLDNTTNNNLRQSIGGGIRLSSHSGGSALGGVGTSSTVTSSMINDLQKEFFGR